MDLDLGTPDHGCLLFGDITGYTDYLQGTELMHAQDVLADLLENLVASIEPVFKLSKLEGDAALAFASLDSLTPTMVMDTVEAAYFAFRRRLRDIVHSTTCECNACSLTPSLDLKFFLHSGEYVLRHIAGTEELTGSDVVLVHRLAKGSSGEAIGTGAYAVYTAPTLDQMAMDPAILGFKAHTESFSDMGDIEVFIQDLEVRWAFEQERHRKMVTSADAAFEHSFVTPAAPAVVWDYLTDPAKRLAWQSGLTGFTQVTEGRFGSGTINHCAHGPDIVVEHVADSRPFSYITTRYDIGKSLEQWFTTQLEPVEEGTRVALRVSDPGNGVWETMQDNLARILRADMEGLRNALLDAQATAAVRTS